MSETPAAAPRPEPLEPTPPAETDPVALFGADAVSGARFLRWNLGAAVLGALALAGGLTLAPARAVPPPAPRPYQLERLATDVTVELPGGTRTADHLRVTGDGAPWEIWLEGGDRPTLVKWKQGEQVGELKAR